MANETNGGRSRNSAPKDDAKATAEPNGQEKRSVVPKEVDQHQIVTVRNGSHGRLVYKSAKTGERYVWDGFGSEQDMEIGELRNAKSANKKFF